MHRRPKKRARVQATADDDEEADHDIDVCSPDHTASTAQAALWRERDEDTLRYHPRTAYYGRAPRFAELAELYPGQVPLRDDDSGEVDWRAARVQLALTKVLLKHYVGVQLELPDGHLCPPVTRCLNYVHWVADLVGAAPRRGARLLDVGTGASCVFALLASKVYGWSCVATDVDGESVAAARGNAARNGDAGARVEVRLQTERGKFFANVVREGEEFDCTMCNPPFFEAVEQARSAPHRVCDATDGELAVDGGELGFVRAMVAESATLRDRVTWFTSMLGHKASFVALHSELMARAASGDAEQRVQVRTTTLQQGTQLRWAVAWSFHHEPLGVGLQPFVKGSFVQGIVQEDHASVVVQVKDADVRSTLETWLSGDPNTARVERVEQQQALAVHGVDGTQTSVAFCQVSIGHWVVSMHGSQAGRLSRFIANVRAVEA